jgi:hypothetical protein
VALTIVAEPTPGVFFRIQAHEVSKALATSVYGDSAALLLKGEEGKDRRPLQYLESSSWPLLCLHPNTFRQHPGVVHGGLDGGGGRGVRKHNGMSADWSAVQTIALETLFYNRDTLKDQTLCGGVLIGAFLARHIAWCYRCPHTKGL